MPDEIIEAAEIDGATSLKSHLYVIVPTIRGALFFVTLISIMDVLRTFDQLIPLAPQAVEIGNESIMLYIYNIAFREGSEQLGLGSAVSVLTILLILLMLTPFIRDTFKESRAAPMTSTQTQTPSLAEGVAATEPTPRPGHRRRTFWVLAGLFLPPRFALAGLSLGGIVAMALVRRAPERVSRLCLMSTTSRPPTSQQYAMWARQPAALAAGATARDLQREIKAALLSPYALTSRPHLVEVALAMADDVGAEILDAQLALQASRVDEGPGSARIRCPTLIISARDDALCSPERHLEMHGLVLGSEFVVLDHCGHLSPLEQPAAVATGLGHWLVREPATAERRGARPGVP